jgi:CO dehydrogenase nickel-insertion accessory protein CooC1
MSVELFRIGVVLSPRPWSGRLHSFIADHVHEVELVVVRDQRAAIEAAADVLLIDDSTPWLNSRFVEEAERAGLRLVGVYDRIDGGVGRDRLASLGLTHLIEEAMPSDDIVFLLDRLRPVSGLVQGEAHADNEQLLPDGERGAVVAAGGPSGSGAREIAIALAAEWASQGFSTLLIDANETTPGVARRLGLGVYPHLLTAVDRVRVEGPSGVSAALADRVGPLPFDVIVGLPTPRDWDRLVGNDVAALLDACRLRWERIVVTTSPLIEDLQRWGDRFGNSRRTLAGVDAIIGCAEPSPRGVLRYLDWLADTAATRSKILTVINKTPKAKRSAADAARQLFDIGGALIDDISEIPFDRHVGLAEWDGTLVKRGKFTKSIAAVVQATERQLALASIEMSS